MFFSFLAPSTLIHNLKLIDSIIVVCPITSILLMNLSEIVCSSCLWSLSKSMIYFTTGKGTASDTFKGIFCGDQIHPYKNAITTWAWHQCLILTGMERPPVSDSGQRQATGLSLVQVLMQAVCPESINHTANSTIDSMETTLKKSLNMNVMDWIRNVLFWEMLVHTFKHTTQQAKAGRALWGSGQSLL